MNKVDVNTKILKEQKRKGFQDSLFEVEFKGSSIDVAIVNALRRASYDLVPSYAFTPESIKIEANESVFDNDQMRNRVSQIRLLDIKHSITFLPRKYWEGVHYANDEREKHVDDKLKIEAYVNYHNDTTEIQHVTTNDITLIMDGEKINKFDNEFPSLIVSLQPNQVYKMVANGVLGIGERSAEFSPVQNCWFEIMDDEGKKSGSNFPIKLSIISKGQLTEKDILRRACKILRKKLSDLKFKLQEKHNIPEVKEAKKLSFILDNESHTLGIILETALQDHNDVIFAGAPKRDHLINVMNFELRTLKKNPLNPLFEAFSYLDELYGKIEKSLK